MNNADHELVRYQRGSALYELYEDTLAWGRRIWPHQAEERQRWERACVDILAEVPSPEQRMSWALHFALALPLVAVPIVLVVHELLARAEEVIRCGR